MHSVTLDNSPIKGGAAMKFTGTLAFGLLLLSACSPDGSETPSEAGSAAPPDNAQTERALLTGLQAYEKVCSTCHATGVNGAPAVGDQQAWSERSPLWEAVLFAHANEGYLGMPPKGGAPGLTEAEVNAAAEYMLMLTFPERPLDAR